MSAGEHRGIGQGDGRYEGERQLLGKNDGAGTRRVARPNLTIAKLLASSGIALASVCVYLNLASVSPSWVSAIIGFIGGALLLAAGFQTQRSIRDRSR